MDIPNEQEIEIACKLIQINITGEKLNNTDKEFMANIANKFPDWVLEQYNKIKVNKMDKECIHINPDNIDIIFEFIQKYKFACDDYKATLKRAEKLLEEKTKKLWEEYNDRSLTEIK